MRVFIKKFFLLTISLILFLIFSTYLLEFIFSKIDSYSNPHVETQEINLTNRFINFREHSLNEKSSFQVSKFQEEINPSFKNKIFKYNTDNNGFLLPGNRHADPDLKIFFLGGSTTENLLVDEENRFTGIFEKKLENNLQKKINVYNSGRSKNNSIHSLNILINKILKLNPTHIFLMHNHNDYYNLTEFNKNSLFDRLRQKERNHIFEPISKNDFNYLMFRSIFFKEFPNLAIRIQIIKKNFFSTNEAKNLQDEMMLNSIDIELFFQEKIKILNIYSQLSKIFNFHLILLTQPENYKNFYKKKENLEKKVELSIKLHDRTNNIYREFAFENNHFLIDLSKNINGKDVYFYDTIHYNDLGSKEIAKVIVNDFISNNMMAKKNVIE